MVTYGLCQHHVTNARIMVKTGQLNHDATMRHLKAFYDGCYEMMKRGVCYVANHHSLTITLTGGY